MKNLVTGRVLEETFRSGQTFPDPDLSSKQMQFLYSDTVCHFMDQEDFEERALSFEAVGSVKDYLKEGELYTVLFFEGKPISIEPPLFMVLEVVERIPGVKGDTAQGGSKPATLETGLVVQVPLFVTEGDKIKVDTRTGKYIERVS